MKKIILQCSSVLLASSLIQWWLFYLSPLDIPEHINNFPVETINLHGLVLWLLFVLILRWFLKRYLRQEPEASLADLISICVLSVLFSEIIFQPIRQISLPDFTPLERVRSCLVGIIGMSFLGGIIGLSAGARLKKNKNRVIPLVTILLLAGLAYGYNYLHVAGYL